MALGDCLLCLDMGHFTAYDQKEPLHHPSLPCRVRMVHWSAPGTAGKDGRRPLNEWTPRKRKLAEQAASILLPPNLLHGPENFHWEGVLQPLTVPRRLNVVD